MPSGTLQKRVIIQPLSESEFKIVVKNTKVLSVVCDIATILI